MPTMKMGFIRMTIWSLCSYIENSVGIPIPVLLFNVFVNVKLTFYFQTGFLVEKMKSPKNLDGQHRFLKKKVSVGYVSVE